MDRSEFTAGIRDAAPALPPNIPFGMLFGATAVQAGITPIAATAMSVFTFAATAQLAAVELLQSGTGLQVVVATVLLINLRYVLFSASLAPKVRHLPRYWRAAISFPLFDINYALAEARYADTDPDERHRGWYFLGASLPFIVVLALSTLAGAQVGQVIGDGFHVDFAIPLIFISLLAPQIKGKATGVAAISSGGFAVIGASLPFNTGLLVAVLCGTGVGLLAEGKLPGWSR
ncbi:AzlC family ABC transporter permease [Halobellus sp. GM3]|uniref:AzlC family ABC transporter permease n=1 Tax=Halobellus sp. GM3 TaxID=3458410 RepID=UPI00403DC7B0